ncbi:hypothetical protein RYX36_021848 [Vicia faba]
MGIYNSHASVGNIIGLVIALGVLEFRWGWSFVVPRFMIILVGLLVFLFLVVNPEDIGFAYPGMDIEMTVEIDIVEILPKVDSEEAKLIVPDNSVTNSSSVIRFLEA